MLDLTIKVIALAIGAGCLAFLLIILAMVIAEGIEYFRSWKKAEEIYNSEVKDVRSNSKRSKK